MKFCDEIPKDRDTSRKSDFVYFEPFIKRHGNATKSWAEATNSCGLNQPLNGGFLSPGDTPDTIIPVRPSLSIETNGFFEVFWDPPFPETKKKKRRWVPMVPMSQLQVRGAKPALFQLAQAEVVKKYGKIPGRWLIIWRFP